MVRPATLTFLQVSLLAGQDFWRTQEIKELGIPALKVTDGPNGARGEYFTDGTPVCSSLARDAWIFC
jgi:hypothetical protein